MLKFFANFFNPIWAVFVMAFVPAIESKVAIPFGISQEIWGVDCLSPVMAGVIAFFGAMLPCIFVIILCKFIKKKTCGVFVDKLFECFKLKFKTKFDKLDSKETTLKKCVLLATFVAIPLPLTGVYSGSIVAGLSNLKVWQGFLSILIGEFISCVIVVALCTIFENSAFYIFVVSIVLCFAYVLFSVCVSLFSKNKHKKRKEM